MTWLYFFLLTITGASIIVIKGESECSPVNDRYFDLLKNKCKYCRKCPAGKGRRFDEARNSPNPINNTECLPCIGCETGTFYDRNGPMSECRNCTQDKCGVLNRQVDKNCTATADFECGHCLPGFDDWYIDTRLACTGPPIKLETPIMPTTPRQPPHSAEDRTHGTIQLMLPLIFGALVAILAIVGVIVGLYFVGCRKDRCRNATKVVQGDLCVSGQSNSTIVTIDSEESALLNEHDVSLDKTLMEKQSVYETDEKQGMDGLRDNSMVDGSVEGQEMDGLAERDNDVRAEMQSGFSVPPSTNGGRPVEFHECNTGKSACKIIMYKDFEKKCSCHQNQCGKHCKEGQLDTLIIGRDSPLLHDVASSICHDPTTLFRQLNIPDAIVYGLDDDRQRRPDKISQREFIQSVLKRWTELMTVEANVGKLRQALCFSGFHRINEVVVSKYRP